MGACDNELLEEVWLVTGPSAAMRATTGAATCSGTDGVYGGRIGVAACGGIGSPTS